MRFIPQIGSQESFEGSHEERRTGSVDVGSRHRTEPETRVQGRLSGEGVTARATEQQARF